MRALEKEVLGCDFGGTSWTTRSQADDIAAALQLAADSHLLEIGAGTGWPGVYLATQTGCEVTLLDIPVNSLKYARQRAEQENIGNHCDAVAASGAALPFTSGAFEAIGHSDVLCCLPEKLAMLKECRRIACAGARMLFYVIAPTRGLSQNDLIEACNVGPPFVGVPDDYVRLLDESGWQLVERTDLTHEYLLALRNLTKGLKANSTTLKEALGLAEFNRQLQHRREQVSAIERGLLEREMYLVKAA